jgi:selenocysteine lyase/cysteine desulfurase
MARMLTRRAFTKLIAAGSAALVADRPASAGQDRPLVGPAPASADEGYWQSVRAQFVMPPDLAVMNAANLCPSSRPVLEVLRRATDDIDADPSPMNREKLGPAKEAVRRAVADFLRVTPGEIVLARNTSEANNLVSSGLDLRPGDEVIVFDDNHPSNHLAWEQKARRHGFTVRVLASPQPHPGMDGYVKLVESAITPKTRLLAFSHVTNTTGDLRPAAELCRLAREREVLTLVDGAQSFGLLDVNLSVIQPDFYSGSAHKWPCGPKEAGVLFVAAPVQPRLWPSIYSAYPGATGLSKTFEGFGQRDEPALIAFAEALTFQSAIGRAAIEQRARGLAARLASGLRELPTVSVATHPSPALSTAVVSLTVAGLDPSKLAAALYRNDRIGCAVVGAGIRFSPHIYNTGAEVDRVLAAVARYARAGV